MPGDTIEIRDNQVYIDGKAAENPENMQFCYYVETDGSPITEEQFRLLMLVLNPLDLKIKEVHPATTDITRI